jgi:hypothetical protein
MFIYLDISHFHNCQPVLWTEQSFSMYYNYISILKSKLDTFRSIPSSVPVALPSSEVVNLTSEEINDLYDIVREVLVGFIAESRIALPKTTLKKATKTNILLHSKVGTCSICLENAKKGEKWTKLSCGHFYHTDCISKWDKKSTNKNCPHCRKPLAENISIKTI